MPVEVRGIWRTDNAKYRDRYLDLDEHFLVFGTGEDEHPNVQRIERIDSLAGARGTLYTVYAKDIEASELKLTFEYTTVNGGEVRLTNPRNVVWRRTPSN